MHPIGIVMITIGAGIITAWCWEKMKEKLC